MNEPLNLYPCLTCYKSHELCPSCEYYLMDSAYENAVISSYYVINKIDIELKAIMNNI